MNMNMNTNMKYDCKLYKITEYITYKDPESILVGSFVFEFQNEKQEGYGLVVEMVKNCISNLETDVIDRALMQTESVDGNVLDQIFKLPHKDLTKRYYKLQMKIHE